MRIFVSWSGLLSMEVAEILVKRLSPLYAGAKFFFSDNDIDPGKVWQHTLMDTLKGSDFCIVCTTRQNIASPWMNFEAGTLAAVTQDNPGVTALLIDLLPTELSGHPLSWFQSTSLTEKSMKQLMTVLHNRLHHREDGEAIADPLLLAQFDTAWTALQSEAEAACRRFAQSPPPAVLPAQASPAIAAPMPQAAAQTPAGGHTRLSWEEYIGLIGALRNQLDCDPSMGGYNFQTIVGLHQGGLQTALILARMYDRHRQPLSLFADRLSQTTFEDSDTARRSNRYVLDALKDPKSGQILVVDGVARTEDTILAARAYLTRALPPEKKVRYAVLVRDARCPATLTEYCVREADTRLLLLPYQYAFR